MISPDVLDVALLKAKLHHFM